MWTRGDYWCSVSELAARIGGEDVLVFRKVTAQEEGGFDAEALE